jgi:hypothetical protein
VASAAAATESRHVDSVHKNLSAHIGATAVVEALRDLEVFVTFKAEDESQRDTIRASRSYVIDDFVSQGSCCNDRDHVLY